MAIILIDSGITNTRLRLLDLFSKTDANERADHFAGTDPLRSVFVHIWKQGVKDYPVMETDDGVVELATVYRPYEIGNSYWNCNQ